jgi:FMN-dependent NADH-azoreductase
MSQIHTLKPRGKALKVLRIDSSVRREGSVTRRVADALIDQLGRSLGPIDLRLRDLASAPPRLLSAEWIGANFTPAEERDPAHRGVLAESDALVAELKAAEVLVIGVPIYNFGIPAVLKAWVDMVARARVTFRYTENGPVDFATGYLRHMLGFLGIEDVEVVAADRLIPRGEDEALGEVQRQIARLLPAPEPLARTA